MNRLLPHTFASALCVLAFFTPQVSTAADELAIEAALDRPLPIIQSIFTGSHKYEITEKRRATHSAEFVRSKEYERLLEFHLRSKLSDDFANLETPYKFYNVAGHGIITGVNIGIATGLVQVFVAFDSGGSIHDVYVQRADAFIEINEFRSRAYRTSFRKFSTAYFLDEAYLPAPGVLPNMNTLKTHDAVMRGVRFCVINYITFWQNVPESLRMTRLL